MFHLLRSGSIFSNSISKLIKRGKSQSRTFSKSKEKTTTTIFTEREEDEPIRKKLKLILDSSKVNHKEEILKQETLKDAHIYCKINNLSGQEAGPLIETFMKEKFNMQKNDPSDCIGDLQVCGLDPKDEPEKPKNVEIKISNGGKANNKFNYVQLRMNHDCNYIFTAYYLDYTNLNQTGELFVFYLDKPIIKELIAKYGSYAHGTIKKLGKISKNDLNSNSNMKEYALRPKYGDKCWNDLLRFRITL